MDEETEEKKKPRIVKRILKWIGLGLLIVLIILGLIFQAPWKVTTLLLIILLACTILPKPARKWFWLSVGVVVIALVVWVFLPDDSEGWRPYTFDEELAAFEAKRAIPDEENAAIIYNQLLDNYDSNSFYVGLPESELRKVPMREPWLRGEHPEIAEWLERHQTTISMLLNASKIEKCRFAINADVLTDTMDRLGPMRQWAYLLISAANNDIAEGRTKESLEKFTAVLQMGNHHRQQPALIDFLVGVALEALSIGQFKSFIVTGDAADEHLIVIEKALGAIKYDWNSDFPGILEHEKLFAKNFWGMFYEVNPKGKVRLSRNPTAAIRAQFPLPSPTYYRIKRAKAGTILGWFFVPSSPQKAAETFEETFKKYYKMAEPNFDWQKGAEKPTTMLRLNYRYLVEHLVSILEPAYYRIYDLYLRVASGQRGSRIIIALRRYKNQNGFWPVNLDDIKSMAPAEIFVDPTNGGDFVYEITEENFRLYSKGKNGIDEDGERDEIAGADDWLIWPPRSRKAKEESTDAEQQ